MYGLTPTFIMMNFSLVWSELSPTVRDEEKKIADDVRVVSTTINNSAVWRRDFGNSDDGPCLQTGLKVKQFNGSERCIKGTAVQFTEHAFDENGELRIFDIVKPRRLSSHIEFKTHVITTTAEGASSVHAIDVDSDGHIDVVSASRFDNTIAWYRNDGNQQFSKLVIDSNANGARTVFAIDVDGDGDVDVIYASVDDNTVAWLENYGNGEFPVKHVIDSNAVQAFSVHAADVDGDGHVDVLSASYGDNTIAWYENNGYGYEINGGFTRKHIIDSNAVNAESVYAANVDGDGDIDVISAALDGTVAWYANNGYDPDINGGFDTTSKHVIDSDAYGAHFVYAKDLDGDGVDDVLSANSEGNEVAWYKKNVGSSFDKFVIDSTANGATSVLAIDMDGDGDIDMLSASFHDDMIAWYENDGNQGFTKHVITTAADGAHSVYAIDMDGDGDIDVLSASFNDDTIAWYENLPVPEPTTGPSPVRPPSPSESSDGSGSKKKKKKDIVAKLGPIYGTAVLLGFLGAMGAAIYGFCHKKICGNQGSTVSSTDSKNLDPPPPEATSV